MKQNYKLSQDILSDIKKANNILINIHRSPDLDTVGSATALYQILKMMGKKTTLVCPHKISENFLFIKEANQVKTVDFGNWEIDKLSSHYDLFLILDSGSYDIVTGSKEIKVPAIKKIIIDHHLTDNWENYSIRLLDKKASATAEVIYRLMSDWKIKINKDIATSLLSGIVGDTVFFKYPKEPKVTFGIVSDLLENGAEYTKIVDKFNDSMEFGFVKIIGEFINKMKIEKITKNKFAWSALPYSVYKKYGFPKGARETSADLFFRSVKGVAFGVAMIEYEPGKISMSFRSKGEFDVSKLAEKFAGGGHKNAAGANLSGNFDESIKNAIDKINAMTQSP